MDVGLLSWGMSGGAYYFGAYGNGSSKSELYFLMDIPMSCAIGV